jgi:hypothetical protein
MSRDKIVMACALMVLSSLMLTTVPFGAAAEPTSTVLVHEDAEQATFDEWNVRWQRGDANPDSGEDFACRVTHNAHASAHGIYMSRNGYNSQYLAPVTMSDGSTGFTQPWNVNITALPSGTPQSQWVMRYDTNQTSIMRKAVVGASDYASITLTFWFWSDTGRSDAKQTDGTPVGYDFLNVVYWTADQVKHVLWTDSEAQASARTWIMVTLDVPNDLTAIGFEFISGSVPPEGGDAADAFASAGVKVKGGMREGVYLDDITLTGSQASGNVPLTTSVDNLASVQGSRTFNVGFTANQPTAGFSHVNLYYRQGSSGEWQKDPGDFSTSPISFTAPADGTYEFFTQGFDASGGSEALRNAADASTVVDTAAPATAIDVRGTSIADNVYSGPVTFTLSVPSDGGSRVNATYYRVDSSDWILYSGAVTLINGGPHRIEYYSIDIAGNIEAAKSRTLTIETDDPVVTFIEPGKVFSSDTATIRFQVSSDKEITEIQVSLDGKANSTVDPELRSVTFTDLTAGTHRVTVWAKDADGRWGQNMTIFSVVLNGGPSDENDDGSIAITLGALSGSYRAGDTVHLTWECTANGTIDHFAILVDGDVIATLGPNATAYDITGLTAGIHEITVLAVDTDGNTAEQSVSISVKASSSGSLVPGGISEDMLIIGGIAVFGLIAAGALIFLRSRKMY